MSNRKRSNLDVILDKHTISDPIEDKEELAIPSWMENWSVGPTRTIPASPQAMPGVRSPQERIESREFARVTVEEQLDAPLREEGGGISRFGQRFRLQGGGRRRTEDIMRSLEQYVPRADVRSVTMPDGSERIVFRRPEREDFEFINPAGFDVGDLGAAASFLFNMENVVATAASVFTRTNAFPIRAALVGAGAAAGRGADTFGDIALGDRPPPIEDVLGDLALSFVFGGAGEAAGTALSRGVNFIRGEGLVRQPEGVLASVRAAREEELAPLTMGQRHPLVARREAQTTATSAIPAERYAEQQASIYQSIVRRRKELTGQDVSPVMTDMELDNLVRQRALNLRETIDNPNISLREGKAALAKGRQEFEVSSAAWVDRKYTRALDAAGDNVTFSLNNVFNVIDDLSVGIQVPTREGIETGTGETMRANRQLGGDLRDIINRLNQMPDSLQGRQGYEAIKSIRSELNDIRSGDWNSADGFRRQDMSAAQQLHEVLTEALENARGPGRVTLESPSRIGGAPDQLSLANYEEVAQLSESDFTRLWRAANTSNAWRERVLRVDRINNLANDTNPAILSELYARPGEFQNLRTIKRIMKPERWKKFTDSVESRLLARPEQINRTFDDFAIEPEALNLIISPQRQIEFRALGKAAERMQASSGAWQRQTDEGRRLLAMVDSGNAREVAELISLNGGPDSPTGRMFRAGILENILNQASEVSPITNQMGIVPRRGVSVISEYLDSGALNSVLTESDKVALMRYRSYLQGISTGADFGGSLAGAEVASQATDILNPKRAGGGILKQAQNAFLARVFISPRANNLVFGMGEQAPPRLSVRTFATVTSLIARDIATKEGQQVLSLFQLEQENPNLPFTWD